MLAFIIFVLMGVDLHQQHKKGKVILKIRGRRRKYRGIHVFLLLNLRSYIPVIFSKQIKFLYK